MISDTLSQAHLYYNLNTHFKKAFDFLTQTDLNSLPLGKTEIDGKNVFVAVSEYTTKIAADAKWEAHKNYIDIQFLAKGREYIGYTPLKQTTVKEAYNTEKDIIILNPVDNPDFTSIQGDTFAIFFPEDAHQPGVVKHSAEAVRKVVVKVAVN